MPGDNPTASTSRVLSRWLDRRASHLDNGDDVQANPSCSATERRDIDRRTVLVGAAGALLGVVLNWRSQEEALAASLESLADVPFDPMLARRLQSTLDHAVAASGGQIPGAILHAERAGHGSWTGTAGLGRVVQ